MTRIRTSVSPSLWLSLSLSLSRWPSLPLAQSVTVGLASLVVTAACGSCTQRDNATQLTVAIVSETEIPKELDTLTVEVFASNGSRANETVHSVQNARFFPATLAVIPRDERSLDGPVTIQVRGSKAGQQGSGQVFRRAVVSFVEGRNLLVPMPLRMACFNFKDCGVNQTCAGGTCQDARIEPERLDDYRAESVFGAAAGNTCFSEARCLARSIAVPVGSDCTFALPDGDRANVSIQWAAAPSRIIALDGDNDVEGWTRVAPLVGKLSPGVCDSLLDPETDPNKRGVPDQALKAFVSTECTTKTAALPFCPAADGHSGIGTILTK